jgi:hypothetical protein
MAAYVPWNKATGVPITQLMSPLSIDSFEWDEEKQLLHTTLTKLYGPRIPNPFDRGPPRQIIIRGHSEDRVFEFYDSCHHSDEFCTAYRYIEPSGSRPIFGFTIQVIIKDI